jgi:signal transduction histidine kinase
MLESLLDISSSKARRGDLRGLETLDLSMLVTRICELFVDSAEDVGLELRWQIAPDITMAGEEMRMARLVTNLLDNAIKYVPSGGHVHVSLTEGPRLVVEDDGPGIAAAERPAIFERFRRGEDHSGDRHGGSGLGLALAAAIAQRHGLDLRLEEKDCAGARFVLEPER